jgi:predicted ATPase
VHGTESEEVRALYDRALALVERVSDISRRFPILWGLWYVAYTRGQYRHAHDDAQRLLDAAQAADDTGQLIEAHHALWATLTATGQSADAIAHAERGISLYERDQHAAQMFVYGGHDPGVCCRYHLAINRWLLGYPDQALLAMHDACRLAEQINHPMTTVITLWFMVWLHYQRGDRELAAETAEQLRALADQHGFKHWREAGIVLPHPMATVRFTPVSLAEVRQRLVGTHSTAWRRTFLLCALAERCVEAGHPEEGLRAIAAIQAANPNAFCAPEVYRIEGELLLSSDASAAEERLRTALQLAQERAEKSLELRAASSLARLWGEQGRKEEAYQLLAKIYGSFTEGLNTRDLVAAKALLAELQS